MGVMKDILVGIREDQDQELKRLASRSGRSRAALIRDAVDRLLAEEKSDAIRDSFGAWGPEGPDGLEYQKAIRAEWSERS